MNATTTTVVETANDGFFAGITTALNNAVTYVTETATVAWHNVCDWFSNKLFGEYLNACAAHLSVFVARGKSDLMMMLRYFGLAATIGVIVGIGSTLIAEIVGQAVWFITGIELLGVVAATITFIPVYIIALMFGIALISQVAKFLPQAVKLVEAQDLIKTA